MTRSDAVALIPGWNCATQAAQLRDLSITGIRVQTKVRVDRNATIRIIGRLFDVVARVVLCRGRGTRFELHGELLRAEFASKTGAVVSLKT